jgi:L-malate glycosyltransferase
VCAGTLVGERQVQSEFALELRQQVRVLPRVDQATLAELYRDADVFIFPSLYEGFSRAIVEAMASRLPIVCTQVGVAGDVLRHEENALIVPKHDAGALVAAVTRLRSNPELSQRLADAAAVVARDYTLAIVSQQTMTVISDAARRPQ